MKRKILSAAGEAAATRRLVIALIVVMVLGFTYGQWRTYDALREARDERVLQICQAGNQSRAAIRSILNLAQQGKLPAALTEVERRVYYRRAFSFARNTDCIP